jgi:hypothetical protein
MAKKKKPAVIRYRDRKTGQFVSKAKWQRSRAHGGARYKREPTISRKPAKRGKLPRSKTRPRTLPKPKGKRRDKEREEREEDIEFGGAFDSP